MGSVFVVASTLLFPWSAKTVTSIFFCTIFICKILFFGEQGWVRALASHQCEPGSNPGINVVHIMDNDFVVGFNNFISIALLSYVQGAFLRSLVLRGFSPGTLTGIPLSSKTNTSKFQFNLERTDTFKRGL